MKRLIQGKINTAVAVSAIALSGVGPAWAHPGIADHAAVQPPAHGMVHAMMGAPGVIIAAGLGLCGVWLLLRLFRRRPGIIQKTVSGN